MKCMLCGKCQLVCPRGVNLRNLILAIHNALETLWNMTFNLFVLPFILGLIFLFFALIKKNWNWISRMDPADKERLRTGLRSPKFFLALKEIFFESLLHRKMFRKNRSVWALCI